ncbi:hypothetical protein BDV98DRAFT_558383 [Pterulicium gracile]|uniref:Uncharacterized protein n=1 Tax=Pterulicium gracile TaxID=1884261 RepID=A0A5C3R8F8_9AGAR|nr:hypothetical protein BDV98DRAFT_558383 [Pterula gracilis]
MGCQCLYRARSQRLVICLCGSYSSLLTQTLAQTAAASGPSARLRTVIARTCALGYLTAMRSLAWKELQNRKAWDDEDEDEWKNGVRSSFIRRPSTAWELRGGDGQTR